MFFRDRDLHEKVDDILSMLAFQVHFLHTLAEVIFKHLDVNPANRPEFEALRQQLVASANSLKAAVAAATPKLPE